MPPFTGLKWPRRILIYKSEEKRIINDKDKYF